MDKKELQLREQIRDKIQEAMGNTIGEASVALFKNVRMEGITAVSLAKYGFALITEAIMRNQLMLVNKTKRS